MNYFFPLTYFCNGLATTLLLIACGLAGQSVLAADIAIAQGATLATFYAFSANARNLILRADGSARIPSILFGRLLLAAPLSVFAAILCIVLAGVAPWIGGAVILRRCTEWFAEVHLSAQELHGDTRGATRYLVGQVVSLGVTLIWTLTNSRGWIVGWYLWALLPLAHCIRFFARTKLPTRQAFWSEVPSLFPHFASTAIIGLAIYVFRLLLALLAGRPLAGELFTAFAAGSFFGSVFANVLGPSIAFYERRTGTPFLPSSLRIFIPGILLLGVAVYFAGMAMPRASLFAGHPQIFWEAAGMSLAGGVIMLLAQRKRLALLHDEHAMSVFGSDILINLLLLGGIPLAYYLDGQSGFVFLYMLNALLCYCFYVSAEGGPRNLLVRRGIKDSRLHGVLALMLIAPVFIQLNSGLYRSTQELLDSGGNLWAVPLPISITGCLLGVFVLGRYRRANLALNSLFVLFVLMLFATVATTSGHMPAEKQKLLLLVQYIIPVFALIVGQMYSPQALEVVADVFLGTVTVLVPWQLIATWVAGKWMLTHYLGLFSVYQHQQYVPVIIIAAFIIPAFVYWPRPDKRLWIMALAPLVGIYALASSSLLALLLYIIGVVSLAMVPNRQGNVLAWLACALLPVVAYGLAGGAGGTLPHIGFTTDAESRASLTLGDTIRNTVDSWRAYAEDTTRTTATLLLGHPQPLDRSISTGAHNYYLDFFYHFGMLPALPLLALLGFTGYRVFVSRAALWRNTGQLGLVLVVSFLLCADNIWKVSLRQPYPGIVTYFLWGLLLACLQRQRSPRPARSDEFAEAVTHAL